MKHKRRRCNAKLDCDVIDVARLFARTNLKLDGELEQAELIIGAIAAREYSRAKRLMEDFARPEFGSATIHYRRKQFTALLSKVPFAGDSGSRKRQAISSFIEAEARCKRTNKRFRHFNRYPNRMPEMPRVLLSRAREWVYRVLGKLSEEKLDKIITLSRPGSGVAIGTRNRYRVSLPFKLGDTDLSTTPRAFPYARRLVEGSPYWLQLHAEIDWGELTWHVPYVAEMGNRFTFVPKDARTLRTIAIEPSLNVCLQLGVHSYMVHRLEEFGNGIRDQQRNQSLARFGSCNHLGSSVATLDLSQASDSNSIEFVRALLPSDWFGLLDDLRCHEGMFEGAPIVFEKFSSMGNGFTFALETLLYWALGMAVNSMTGGEILSVYGDDIIISDESSLLLTELLTWCGLVVNHDKSFYVGPFRESCGADWHEGSRVTPLYIRKASFRPTDVYLLLNRGSPDFNWALVREYLLAKHREKEPILFGLENEDASSCLFTSFDYLKGGAGRLTWHPEWQTWQYPVWKFFPEGETVPPLTGLAAALHGSQGKDARYQLRGRGKFRLVPSTPGVVPRG